MKRKTNLFYNQGLDSNFVTFSNYAESLTGNLLSTTAKIYPYKFLCLYIPELLTDDAKRAFLDQLCAYYENKLAAAKDYCNNNDLSIETNIHPLSWLIEAIDKILGANTFSNSLVHISSYIENEYNGIYADYIFTIYDINLDVKDSSVVLHKVNKSNNFVCPATDSLYGWSERELTSIGCNIKPEFDNATAYSYNLNPAYDNIAYEKKSLNDSKDLIFNIIIPLYNVTNINANPDLSDQLFTSTASENKINFGINTTMLSAGNILVPYGIWFSGDHEIELKYDSVSKQRTNWSLTLSQQFKPFPYSTADPADELARPVNTYSFAEVLKNYASLAKTVNDMSLSIIKLNERNRQLQEVINNIDLGDGDSEAYLKLENKIESLQKRITEIENIQTQTTLWELAQ